jgi:nucleolar protein 14
VGVLIDHILHVASPSNPRISVVSSLLPHIHALTKTYPRQTAEHFIGKLALMHKNLKRGLSHSAAGDGAKTWPDLPELVFLRVLGVLWPTSDMRHAVVSPVRLLMGSYLSLCKIRSLVDAASGLFLCTLFLQYESRSGRFVPEAINFLIDVIRALSPPRAVSPESERSPSVSQRRNFGWLCLLDRGKAKTLSVSRPNLVAIIGDKRINAQTNADLLGLAVDLLARFSQSHKTLEGFIELYDPVLQMLRDVDSEVISPFLRVRLPIHFHCLAVPNSIQGSNISDHRHHPETHTVLSPGPPAFIPPSTQTYTNPVVHSEVREYLLILSSHARSRS